MLGYRPYENESKSAGGNKKSVRIKWLKQRALKKLLEAGISGLPRSARKTAGAAGKMKGFPGGNAGPGQRRTRGRFLGRGVGHEASPSVRQGRRGRGSAPGPGGSVHSSHARQFCEGGWGEVSGGPLSPGKRRCVSPQGRSDGGSFAAATGLYFLWMPGGGSPADPLPAHGEGSRSPFCDFQLLRVSPS